MFQFTIVSRMNTRSTSYSKRSIVAAIEKAGLTFVQEKIMLRVDVPTLEARRRLEYELQQVDKDVAYRIEVKVE
jgi:hypothetical protein